MICSIRWEGKERREKRTTRGTSEKPFTGRRGHWRAVKECAGLREGGTCQKSGVSTDPGQGRIRSGFHQDAGLRWGRKGEVPSSQKAGQGVSVHPHRNIRRR